MLFHHESIVCRLLFTVRERLVSTVSKVSLDAEGAVGRQLVLHVPLDQIVVLELLQEAAALQHDFFSISSQIHVIYIQFSWKKKFKRHKFSDKDKV